ncbi:MAG: hypothetical protein ACOCRX_08800 [Candidatus Woesearchaeota archaeon]
MIDELDYCIKLLKGKEDKYINFRKEIKNFKIKWFSWYKNNISRKIKDQPPANFKDKNLMNVWFDEDILGFDDLYAELSYWQSTMRKKYKLDFMERDVIEGTLKNFNKYQKFIEFEINQDQGLFYWLDNLSKRSDNITDLNKIYSNFFLELNYKSSCENRLMYNIEEVNKWSENVKKRIEKEDSTLPTFEEKEKIVFKLFKQSFKYNDYYLNDIKKKLNEIHLHKYSDEQEIKVNTWKEMLGLWSKPVIGGYKTKDATGNSILIYVNQSNTNKVLWDEFINLLFKWNFPNYTSFDFLYDSLNIHTHPFYLFLNCCVVFNIDTIDDPVKCLHENKSNIFYLHNFFSKYKAKLNEIKIMLDDPGYEKKDIKNFINKIKLPEDNLTPVFFYPGKLPSLKTWKQIYQEQKKLGNVNEGRKSGQIDKRIRNYKMYLDFLNGKSKTEITNKYIINEGNIKHKDAYEGNKNYKLCSEGIKGIISDLNLIET